MTPNKLRIGIIIDSFEIAEWLYISLERIYSSPAAEVVTLIHDTSLKNSGEKTGLLFKLFSTIDKRLFRNKIRTDSLALKNLQQLTPNTPCLEMRFKEENNCHYLDAAQLQKIKDLNLDILIKACNGNFNGEILRAAKYGIWAHYFNDLSRIKGGPPGFWEAIEKLPTTGSPVEIHNGKSGEGKVIYRFATTTYHLSPYVNKNFLYSSSSTFLSRQIEKLHRLGEEQFFEEIDKLTADYTFYSHKEYGEPQFLQMLYIGIIYVTRILTKAVYERLYWDQWYMLYHLGSEGSNNINNYIEIVSPKDEFWADPFILQRDGIYYLYFEVYSQKTRKGHLSVLQFNQDGSYTQPMKILETNYHLSYPCIVEIEDRLYMIPETKGNKTIELYECTKFPNQWEFKMNLMENINAVDTTPFFHKGKWWLFTTLSELKGTRACEDLFIFYADELCTTNWTPHPLNPVVTDARYARPAGDIIVKNNRIYRPSQYCGTTYGHALIFNEIVTLSETEYLERKSSSIFPNWDKGITCVHTFTQNGDLTVIDANKGARRG